MAASFQQRQQELQSNYLQRPEFAGKVGDRDPPIEFLPEYRQLNLAPSIAKKAFALFDHEEPNQKIQWHRYAGHGCSSQACCVNFLLPLQEEPELLGFWIDHVLGINGAQPEPIETRHGQPRLIAFEWFPPDTDYLNELERGVKSRGANSTSVDAAITFRIGEELRLLLVEWKYIERYSDTRDPRSMAGDRVRLARYGNIWKRPHGPLRSDLEIDDLTTFFLDPWYQLLRQMMLAYHAETDPLSPYSRVSLVHISPSGNTALKKVNGEAFRTYAGARGLDGDLLGVFSDMIASEWRDRFVPLSTEDAFRPIGDADHMAWLRERYPDLFDEKDIA